MLRRRVKMTDRQNRVGSKTGGGGMASGAQAAMDRKERLRKLAMETIDLSNDPYFMRNHLGSFECRLCNTLHTTEGNYLSHTQARRHQANMGRRAARDAKAGGASQAAQLRQRVQIRRTAVKIGRPGFSVQRLWDAAAEERGLRFELVYPEVAADVQPRHRIMSAYEQHVGPKDARYQYLVFAAEPYETVAFRVPAQPLNKERFATSWDRERKAFSLTLFYLGDKAAEAEAKRASQGAAHRPQIQFRGY